RLRRSTARPRGRDLHEVRRRRRSVGGRVQGFSGFRLPPHRRRGGPAAFAGAHPHVGGRRRLLHAAQRARAQPGERRQGSAILLDDVRADSRRISGRPRSDLARVGEERVSRLLGDRNAGVSDGIQGRSQTLARDVSGKNHVRHGRLSVQRDDRRRTGLLDRRAERPQRAGGGARGDDRGARDHARAGARDGARVPSRHGRKPVPPMTRSSEREASAERKPALRRVLTFRDLFLYYLATGFSLRWIATAAAAGPSAIVIWLIAALGLFVPLVFSTLELASRYPEEGGIYVWSKRAFGPFAAFMTGWLYWGSNLPYFPGLLYFAAANALFIGGPSWQALSGNSTYFIAVAMAGLTIAVTMNVVGLNVGKWLNNVGAMASWIPALLLILLGAVSWRRFGSATPMNAHAFVPSTSLKDVIFWSTIAFAFGGVESGSTMGEEIHDARRTVPRAVLAAGAVVTILYICATLAILLAMPKEQISGLQGIMQAIQALTVKVGVGWLAPPVAALVTLNALGGVGGWFAATARLPFVAGIDRFLPPAFGRL